MCFSPRSSTECCEFLRELLKLFFRRLCNVFREHGIPFPVVDLLLRRFDCDQSMFQLLFEKVFNGSGLNVSDELSFAVGGFSYDRINTSLGFLPKMLFHLSIEAVNLLQLLLQRTTLLRLESTFVSQFCKCICVFLFEHVLCDR